MPAVKPGARRLQILQVLARMLENPKGEKVTTAALAKELDVSEAALCRYRAASDTSSSLARAAVVTFSPFGFSSIRASTCRICRRRAPGLTAGMASPEIG